MFENFIQIFSMVGRILDWYVLKRWYAVDGGFCRVSTPWVSLGCACLVESGICSPLCGVKIRPDSSLVFFTNQNWNDRSSWANQVTDCPTLFNSQF
jgi:hypothetical protein